MNPINPERVFINQTQTPKVKIMIYISATEKALQLNGINFNDDDPTYMEIDVWKDDDDENDGNAYSASYDIKIKKNKEGDLYAFWEDVSTYEGTASQIIYRILLPASPEDLYKELAEEVGGLLSGVDYNTAGGFSINVPAKEIKYSARSEYYDETRFDDIDPQIFAHYAPKEVAEADCSHFKTAVSSTCPSNVATITVWSTAYTNVAEIKKYIAYKGGINW